MDQIARMLSGEMSMESFLLALRRDEELRKNINALVPTEAINHPEHPIWKYYSYSALSKAEFDLSLYLDKSFNMDLSAGDNLNIFGAIKRFYCFFHPDFICTSWYSEVYGLYLDVVGDCYEGPEVKVLLDSVIAEAMQQKTKTARRKEAKEKIRLLFPLAEGKKPYWIQGAEWPMGEKSPMQFVGKKRHGERVDYTFRDVDTGTERVVVQYY